MSATLIYLAAGLVALALVWFLGLDYDPGGYQDQWTTPDKQAHAFAASTLTLGAVPCGVPPLAAALVTVALGVGWEVVQKRPRAKPRGFASVKDVVAVAAGAAASYLWIVLWR